ncbi:unnamed protein product, partial [Scytosiphon promiscuus]
CSFFENPGSCRYGPSCKFLHGASAGGAPATPAHTIAAPEGAATPGSSGAPAASAECGEGEHKPDAGDNCGICLENIPSSGKRFGLLNCDHVYCLGTL